MVEFNSPTVLWSWWAYYGSDIANGAIILSALAAWGIIVSGRSSTKRKTTIEMIQNFENDIILEKSIKEFLKLKKIGQLDQYGSETNKNSKEAGYIKITLNHYELMAVAIAERIACDELYKRWQYTTILSNYEPCIGYISAVRNRCNSDTLYMEFEKMAKRWKKHPLKRKLTWLQRLCEKINE